MSRKTKKKLEAENRQAQLSLISDAVQYRLMGYDYPDIASTMSEELKTPITREQVIGWVADGLAHLHREPAEQQTLLELQRVNVMMTKVFESAQNGDSPSIDLVLKLSKRREELENKLVPVKSEEPGQLFGPINTEPSKRGRPEHIPTEKTRAMVEAFAIAGTPYGFIAKRLGISEPTLVKHYGELLEIGRDCFLAECVGHLATSVRRGREASIFFALKTKGGWRETHHVEATGADGTPLIPAADLSKMPLLQFVFTEERVENNGANGEQS